VRHVAGHALGRCMGYPLVRDYMLQRIPTALVTTMTLLENELSNDRRTCKILTLAGRDVPRSAVIDSEYHEQATLQTTSGFVLALFHLLQTQRPSAADWRV
jgi:hypothetical protein